MTEVLLREPMPVGASPLVEAPGWLRPANRDGRYWHKPRSAYVAAQGWMAVRMWCGQSRTRARLEDFTEEAPADLRCGTCIGRRMGFDAADGLVFRPDDHWGAPKWCPGRDSGSGHWRTCALCGGKRKFHYSPYGGGGEDRHHAGPGLINRVDPCPWHGWRDLVQPSHPTRNFVVYRSYGCTHVSAIAEVP